VGGNGVLIVRGGIGKGGINPNARFVSGDSKESNNRSAVGIASYLLTAVEDKTGEHGMRYFALYLVPVSRFGDDSVVTIRYYLEENPGNKDVSVAL
jgi:hypothetical protein